MRNNLLKYSIFLIAAVGVILVYLFYDIANTQILLKIRLPRLMLAILTGGILGGVGSIYQLMLKNPLAEPYILGISTGAALGRTVGAIIGFYVMMPIFGFLGALLTMLIVWKLASSSVNIDSVRLILSGIIIGILFSSVISLLLYLNQNELGAILHTIMGNLGHIFTVAEWRFFLIVSGISAILMVYLYFQSNQLDILGTGDLTATSLGISIRNLRLKIFVITSVLVGVTVSYAGVIGFVGLIVPHIVRMIFKSEQKTIYPMSILFGVILLVVCDFIAMHLTYIELPIGIVTSIIGSPFFIYLLLRDK